MGDYKDIAGQKFGLLTALYRAEPHITKSGKRITMWVCRCDCGKTKTIRYSSLINGDTRSCGCATGELGSESRGCHRESKTRLYGIWCDMRRRCYSPNAQYYYCYGEKGVEVCEEWRTSYIAFRDWALAHGYKQNLTLDRIDSDGNYCPENCRWASLFEQANNKKSWNRLLTLEGVTHNVTEWANLLGISPTTLFKRKSAGWSDEKALTEPVHNTRPKGHAKT